MMNMKEETCTCPECGKTGPMSEFMPKQFAEGKSNEKKPKHGLEIYIMGSKDGGSDEQENG